MKYLLINLVPIAFIACAALLGVTGHDGWGWCLFLAFITSHSFNGHGD